MDATTTRCAQALLRQALSPLAALIADEAVTEIMVNAPREIWAQRAGQIERVPLALDPAALEAAVVLLARLAGRGPGVAGSDPWVEARFDDLRVAACAPPLSPAGPALCLRRHRRRRLTLAQLAQAVPQQAPALACLGEAARRGEAILLAGATDSGKTTLLNALCAEIPPVERVITIEDTPELEPALPHRVALACGSVPGTTMRDLLRLALRMRPDRLLVGEVRGGEAFDLVQAAMTGHRGMMATVHAGDPLAALARLESLALCAAVPWPARALREAIAHAFDLVALLEARGGVRAVREVARVRGWDPESGYRLQWLAGVPGPARAALPSSPAQAAPLAGGCARA